MPIGHLTSGTITSTQTSKRLMRRSVPSKREQSISSIRRRIQPCSTDGLPGRVIDFFDPLDVLED